VAYGTDDGKEANVWIYDLSGATAPRKLTFGGANRYPIWTADGERVAFQSDREGDTAIWWQRADGNGVPERLTKPEKGTAHTPDSWSPDNQNFLFSVNNNNTAAAWVFSLKDKKATLFAEVPSSFAGRSVFSPDGHWVAYQVLESGETRVYVQPFPATGAKYQVPPDGNTHHPVWSPDGKELFYIPGNGRLDSVSFSALPSPAFGPPVPMPKGSGVATREPGAIRSFDILPNGKFIGVVRPDQVQAGSGSGSAATPQIQVVLNWFEELKQRVPVR
jgi:Tol biopolymer transport system component